MKPGVPPRPRPPGPQQQKPVPPPRARPPVASKAAQHPGPPGTQQGKPIPTIIITPPEASQTTLPAASQGYDSLERPRRPPPPPPSCGDIPEGPTTLPLPPTVLPRRQQAERSGPSLPEYLPPPPEDWLEELRAPAPREDPRAAPHEARTNKTFSRRKERKQLGLVGSLTVDVPVAPDPYFKTDSVLSLNIFNFDEFIKAHEKTIIMFFHSRKKESFYPSKEFANVSNNVN